MLVTQKDNGAGGRRGEARKRGGAVRQLDGDDAPARFALKAHPALLAGAHPVQARSPARPERVAPAERLAVVLCVGHRETCAGCVACPHQRPEVLAIRDPQGSDDEVIPTAVPSRAAYMPQLLWPGLRGAQRAEAIRLPS